MMSAGDRVEELAHQVAAPLPSLGSSEQAIALAVLRELACGAPVSVNRLAAAADLSEARMTDALDRLPGVFRDERQSIVGFMGLTVVEMGHHRVHLDGRTLSAWCAWDTLFLPELLGETVTVTSRSPASDAQISLTVTPTGTSELEPPGAVVSFLLPSTAFAADVIQRFCHFVHFFASTDDSEGWVAEHPGTFVLSVADAYRLGQLTNHAVIGTVLAPVSG
jgi:alkylmercury lyase